MGSRMRRGGVSPPRARAGAAGQRGNPDTTLQDDYFHYAFSVREGASLVIENSEIREAGSRDQFAYGVLVEADGARIVSTLFTGNFDALVLRGSNNSVIDGNTFVGNMESINGGGSGLAITNNVLIDDPIPSLPGNKYTFKGNLVSGQPGFTGASLGCTYGNCTFEGNRWEGWGSVGFSDSA